MRRLRTLAPFFLLTLSAIFLACNRKDPWQDSAIHNRDPSYDLAKLSYPADSSHRGIQLEFIRQHETIEGYISVYTFEIPPLQKNPHLAKVTFLANGKAQTFTAVRRKGGQRLHLSEESLTQLLKLFQESSEVTIQTGHYSQTFYSTSFKNHYRKLCKLPPHLLPEKMITFELY